jgi:ABC-type phosphate transport system substrate-binding protein
MRKFLTTAIVVFLAAATALGVAYAQAPVPPYRVIVNQKNSTASADRRFVAQLFLKKTTHWSDGDLVRPVDLEPASAARRRFSEEVLNRSIAAVKSYWQQMIFAGRDVPPPELDSDEEVVRFVARHPGAIGYVGGGANTALVKVLALK